MRCGGGTPHMSKRARSEAEALSYVGKQIGSLTVLRQDGWHNNRMMVLCLCACGAHHTRSLTTIKHGRRTSCKYAGLTVTDAESRDRFRTMTFNAKVRGLAVEISVEQAALLFSAPCHYCGRSGVGKPLTKRAREQGIGFNGIDRVDNAKGYIVGNVVTCCGDCNVAKSDMTASQFINLCVRVAAKHADKPTPNQERQL